MNKRDNIIKWSIISIFVILYGLVSIISTIHVIDFFKLSNPKWLAITLAIAFEIGAAASLAAIIILDKTSKSLVWMLFIIITLMQMMGNMYFAYTHLTDYKNWSELFGMIEEEAIFQKRVLSIVSGAILPIVALGFIKSLVDYIRPSTVEEIKEEYENKKAIEDEITREAIDEFIPTNEEDLAEIEKIKNEIAKIESNDEITDKEKSRKTEQKIAKAIAKNPELKKQIEEKIREIDEEDTYTKIETIEEDVINTPPVRSFGGM